MKSTCSELNELAADITYPLVDVHILIWPVVPDFDLVNGLVPAQVSSSGVRMTFLHKHEKSHLLHKCLSIPEVTYRKISNNSYTTLFREKRYFTYSNIFLH